MYNILTVLLFLLLGSGCPEQKNEDNKKATAHSYRTRSKNVPTKDDSVLLESFFLKSSLRVNSDTLNIRDFGALGNGINDDHKAIQNAINQLAENQILFIPKGKYFVKGTLNFNKSNVQVVGEGENSIIQYKWDKFSKTKKLLYGFHIRDAKNVLFKNFKIHGGAKNFQELIIDDWKEQTWDVDGAYNLFLIQPKSDYAVSNITFDNLWLSNSFFDGIHSYARPADPLPKYRSKSLTIRNCYFKNIGSNGVGVGLVNGIVVENSKFYNIGLMKMTNTKNGGGMAIDASGGAENVLMRNNYIDGAAGGLKCETHENNGGKYLPSKNITIVGNTIKNLFEGPGYDIFYGIKINGVNVKVVNNRIESIYHGVLVGINAEKVNIDNNIIKVTGNGAAGIRLDRNIGNHIVSNNQILGSNGQGILVSDANNIIISNNIVLKCKLDNIRIVGGTNIHILNNICADAGNPNITVVPIEGLSISDVIIKENICYSLNREVKPSNKRILVANASRVETMNNRLLVEEFSNSNYSRIKSNSLNFAKHQPSTGMNNKGEIVLKSRQNTNLISDNVLGWECTVSGSPGKWRVIKVAM